MESVNEAIDLATQGLHDWNYISTQLKFPGYCKIFTNVCPPRLTRWFVLKKLRDGFHICYAFIHTHIIARQLLLDYTAADSLGIKEGCGQARIRVLINKELFGRKDDITDPSW